VEVVEARNKKRVEVEHAAHLECGPHVHAKNKKRVEVEYAVTSRAAHMFMLRIKNVWR